MSVHIETLSNRQQVQNQIASIMLDANGKARRNKEFVDCCDELAKDWPSSPTLPKELEIAPSYHLGSMDDASVDAALNATEELNKTYVASLVEYYSKIIEIESASLRGEVEKLEAFCSNGEQVTLFNTFSNLKSEKQLADIYYMIEMACFQKWRLTKNASTYAFNAENDLPEDVIRCFARSKEVRETYLSLLKGKYRKVFYQYLTAESMGMGEDCFSEENPSWEANLKVVEATQSPEIIVAGLPAVSRLSALDLARVKVSGTISDACRVPANLLAHYSLTGSSHADEFGLDFVLTEGLGDAEIEAMVTLHGSDEYPTLQKALLAAKELV